MCNQINTKNSTNISLIRTAREAHSSPTSPFIQNSAWKMLNSLTNFGEETPRRSQKKTEVQVFPLIFVECNHIVVAQICINVKKKKVFEFSLIPPFDRLSEGMVGKTQPKCFPSSLINQKEITPRICSLRRRRTNLVSLECCSAT